MKKSFLTIIWILFAAIQLLAQNFSHLIDGQDPSVAYKDGFYYLIQSEGSLVLRQSQDIDGLKTAPKTQVWPNQCCNVWAPELQWINGKWYIYYTKDDGNNDNHRMYVLESTGTDPAGPYTDKGKIAVPNNDKWAIDGSVLQKEDGSLYFIWSGWPGDINGQQNLYIAPMSNPYTISGERVLISEPTYLWERSGMPINEGPQPYTKNGKYFVTYSASGSWTDDYCLGLISNKDGDLLNPGSWVKSKRPVFVKSETAYGPGHHCLVEGPNGECYNVYHANHSSGTGWDGRSIRVQNFSWDENDQPVFGNPYSLETKLEQAPLPIVEEESALARLQDKIVTSFQTMFFFLKKKWSTAF